jgi:hypothetical protein
MIFDVATNYGYRESSSVLAGSPAYALVESARNDYALFNAILECDAREVAMYNSDYVNESAIDAFNENVVTNVFKKIADFFRWLGGKIKEIFNKIKGWFTKNAANDNSVAKSLTNAFDKFKGNNYPTIEVKTKLSNKYEESTIADDVKDFRYEVDVLKFIGDHLDDGIEGSAMFLEIFDTAATNIDEFKEAYKKKFYGDERTITYVCNRSIVEQTASYLVKGTKSEVKNLDFTAKRIETYCNKEADSINKRAKDNPSEKDYATVATKFITNYKTCILYVVSVMKQVVEDYYKVSKAAALKMISALNNGGSKNEAAYIYAEADVQDEVDGVIGNAIDGAAGTEIEDLSMADSDLGSYTNDPDKLTYAPDSYTSDYLGADSLDGSVRANIRGTTEESAILSSMLY